MQVEPNPTLRGVRTQGTVELPPSVVNAAFQGQEGGVINFSRFGQSLKAINGWYQQNGVFGQVRACGNLTMISVFVFWIWKGRSKQAPDVHCVVALLPDAVSYTRQRHTKCNLQCHL